MAKTNNDFNDDLDELGSVVGKTAVDGVSGAGSVVAGVGHNIGKAAQPVVDTATGIGVTAGSEVAKGVGAVGDTIGKAASGTVSGVVKTGTGLASGAVGVGTDLASGVVGIGKDVASGVGKGVDTVTGIGKTAVDGVTGVAKSGVELAGKGIDAAANVAKDVGSTVGKGVDAVGKTVGNIGKGIGNFLGDMQKKGHATLNPSSAEKSGKIDAETEKAASKNKDQIMSKQSDGKSAGKSKDNELQA